MATLYRIKKGIKINYSEKEDNTINFKEATKLNKYAIINYIRSHYKSTNIKDIVNGTYKAILENGFLVGVSYKL